MPPGDGSAASREWPVTYDLPARPEAGALARQVLRRLDGMSEVLREDALLLCSELVSNAVRHGREPIRLAVEWHDRLLRVGVTDAGDTPPGLPAEPALDAEGGRGLRIVHLLARDWGIESHPGSTRIWFELADDAAGPEPSPSS